MSIQVKQEKFLEAYNPIKDSIWRYCLFMTRNREAAKDLLGETITAAYQSFDNLKDKKSFLGYLFTIASRIYYKIHMVNKFDLIDKYDFDTLFATDLSSEVKVDISFLYDNLNRLSDEQKETIILFNIDGFSRKEIAQIQNVSEETVKSRLSRGKKQLAKLMGVNYEEES